MRYNKVIISTMSFNAAYYAELELGAPGKWQLIISLPSMHSAKLFASGHARLAEFPVHRNAP